jgi:flagellar assembly protein FliH
MSSATNPAARVWRGLPVARLPLRLPERTTRQLADAAPDPQLEASQEWQRAFDQGVREGREEGLRRGYEEGQRRGMDDATTRNEQAVREAVAEAVAGVDAQRAQLAVVASALEHSVGNALAAAEEEMVALCYEALCRILAAEAVRPEVVVAQVRGLLAQRSGSALLAVHVHPDDAALLPSAEEPWVADPEVALGGCVLRTRSGGLDLRLDVALENCKAALLRTRDERARAALGARSSP